MRYPPDHKARARETLLRAGARSLKTCGFNGIGVDGLAAAAGVTSGAFYSNFPNKEAMLEAVIDARAGRTVPVGYRFGNSRRGAGTPDQFSSGLHQRRSQPRRGGGLRDARLERRRLARATAR